METGSLVNLLMSGTDETVPAVGLGATILGWTDRYAATIVKVTKTQVHVQRDIATRTDNNGMSESQSYAYTPNPEARVEVFRLTKLGYRNGGLGLRIGVRKSYFDYSF